MGYLETDVCREMATREGERRTMVMVEARDGVERSAHAIPSVKRNSANFGGNRQLTLGV